jgi:hypothetical protein
MVTPGSQSTFIVTNTNDSGDGSLRKAILDADSTSGAAVIQFNIASDSSVQTIHLASALPALTNQTLVDGWTESGYRDHPLVELDGSGAGSAADGLTISTAGASGTTVRGLAIYGFTGNGVAVKDPNIAAGDVVSNVTLESLFIGVDAKGATFHTSGGKNVSLGNGGDGILLAAGVQGTQVGTPEAAAANIIANNGGDGVHIIGRDHSDTNETFPIAKLNSVEGNYLGVTLAGGSSVLDTHPTLHAAGNKGDGILLEAGAAYNYVAANVIGGNTGNGIKLDRAAHNQLSGNFIGTDSTADNLGNTGDGILIKDGSTYNRAGGGSHTDLPQGDSKANVISANGGDGVHISGTGTSFNVIDGNTIGEITYTPSPTGTVTFPDGTTYNKTFGNFGDGVLIDGGATWNVVGSTSIGSNVPNDPQGTAAQLFDSSIGTAGDSLPEPTSQVNYISLNQGAGVEIVGTGTNNNFIVANSIGVNPADSTPQPSNGSGILVSTGSVVALLRNSLDINSEVESDRTTDGQDPDVNVANEARNFPVITSAVSDTSGTAVTGTLNSVKDTAVHIELFFKPYYHTDQEGEGYTYLGSVDGTTNDAGNLSFSFDLSKTLPDGQIDAMATVNGATTEFSEFDFPLNHTATIDLVSGNNQSADVNTAFASPLTVSVQADSQALAGVVVKFTAPADGSSGYFQTSNGRETTVEVLTDSNGDATAPTFVANSFAGSNYNVTASLEPSLSDPVLFSLKNLPVTLSITGYPSPQGAGVAGNFTVSVTDQKTGAAVKNYLGTFTFSTSDSGKSVVLPPNSQFTSAGLSGGSDSSFSATLQTLGLQSITVTDSANPNLTATQNDILVVPGPAALLDVTQFPGTVTAGSPDAFTVVVRDKFGNVATNYTGTVTLTISPAVQLFLRPFGFPSVPQQQPLTFTHTFTAADKGQFSFQAALTAVGSDVLMVGDGKLQNNANLTVVPGNPASVEIINLPTTVTAGQATQITIAVRDASGNLVNAANESVTLTSSDPNAVLPDVTPLPGGWALFSVAFNKAGSDTLTVNDNNGLTASQTVTVPDTLTPTSKVLVASVDTPLTAVVVAHFDDSAATATGKYSASIDWGDGVHTATTGTVVAASGGGFDVLGTLPDGYATDSMYTIHVAVSNSLRGTSVNVDSTAVVLTGREASNIKSSSFLDMPDGTTSGTVQTDGATAVVNEPAGSDGTTVFLGLYSTNPEGAPLAGESIPSGTLLIDQFQMAYYDAFLRGTFYELKVSNLDDPNATIQLVLSFKDLANSPNFDPNNIFDPNNVVLEYFNVAEGKYEKIVPAGQVKIDSTNDTLTITLDNKSSTPLVKNLVHTVFTITLAPPPVQVTQSITVTPTVAEVNTSSSILGQSLTRGTDATASRTVVVPLGFETTGPTLALAPSSDRTTSNGATSAVVTEDETDLEKIAAAARQKAERFVRQVGDEIEQGVRKEPGVKSPPKVPEQQPEESDEAAVLDDLSKADEAPGQLRLLDALFADAPGDGAALMVADMEIVVADRKEDEGNSPVWAAAGLVTGFAFTPWTNPEEEEDEELVACGAEEDGD